ncbi:MAG: amidohydrolase family protein [Clostridia bacterium]|jgi:predicted TIM-barrel fold metal-dependent hydrolase|nr:amidohydrolase family protein [Clostridiaceae bacterium]
MLLDSHIHIFDRDMDRDDFYNKLKEGGVDGGIVISLAPDALKWNKTDYSSQNRLDNVLWICEENPLLFPFYWLNPLEKDAIDQVREAVACGIKGFKIICNTHYPGDPAAMKVYNEIAKHEKPVLFHSGILWDGLNSSEYNKPSRFEALLEVNGLKFALAHVSWPWHDECIAVYGKFLNAYTWRKDLSVEMFIDIAPGTPPLYRKEVLTKLYCIGYDIENNLLFGTDSNVNDYNIKWLKDWLKRDQDILAELDVKEEAKEALYGKNLLRFVNEYDGIVAKKLLVTGE